jgi:hypothetical protein
MDLASAGGQMVEFCLVLPPGPMPEQTQVADGDSFDRKSSQSAVHPK